MFLLPQLPVSVQLFTWLEANCTLGREGLFGPGSVLCTMSKLYSVYLRSTAASVLNILKQGKGTQIPYIPSRTHLKSAKYKR